MRLNCSWHHHWLAGLKGVTRFRVQILSCLLPWNPVLCFTLYLPTEGSGDFLSDNRDGSLAVLPLVASSWCGVLGFLPFCLDSKIFKICAWIPHSKSLHVHFGVQYPFQIFPWSLQATREYCLPCVSFRISRPCALFGFQNHSLPYSSQSLCVSPGDLLSHGGAE